MDQPNDFNPRLTDASLVFASEYRTSITDLKWGIRQFLARHHHQSTALVMAHCMNYNYLRSKDRTQRVILVSADSSPLADSIVIDLYARLLQNRSEIVTAQGTYIVTLHGNVDLNKVAVLSQHYFWMSSAFKEMPDRNSDRHMLN